MKREKSEKSAGQALPGDAKSAEQALPGDAKSAEQALPGDGKLHPPPSILWFIIPLGMLMLYALLTR